MEKQGESDGGVVLIVVSGPPAGRWLLPLMLQIQALRQSEPAGCHEPVAFDRC
jgi:hypothetical protein